METLYEGFFTGTTDSDLNRGFIGDRSDFFLSKIMNAYVTGTSSLTSLSAVTFTPTSGEWVGTSATVSDYVGGFLFIQNDDGLGVVLDIAVSTAGSAPVFTVDLTDSFFGRDESANFTTATAYTFHVVSARRYLGYTFEKLIESNPTENMIQSGSGRELKPLFKWTSASEPKLSCQLDNKPTSMYTEFLRFSEYATNLTTVYKRESDDTIVNYAVFIQDITQLDGTAINFLFPYTYVSLPNMTLEITRGGDATPVDLSISILQDGILLSDGYLY